MLTPLNANRIIRATSEHKVLDGFHMAPATNALKYAARSHMSKKEIAACVVTGGLYFIIHRLLRHWYAHKREREQSQVALRTIVAKSYVDKEDGLTTIRIKVGDEFVYCKEEPYRDNQNVMKTRLWIQVPGKDRQKHLELNSIEELKTFYKSDIKINSAYYAEKNPGSPLFQLFDRAKKAGNIDQLLGRLVAVNDFEATQKNNPDTIKKLGEDIHALETWIEENHPDFIDILQVEMTQRTSKKKTFDIKVTFDDFNILRKDFDSTQFRLDPTLFEFDGTVSHTKRNTTIISKPTTKIDTEAHFLRKATNSSDSFAFQVNFLKLANFYRKKEENFGGLSIRVDRQQGRSIVRIFKKNSEEVYTKIGTVYFNGKLEINDQLFDLESEKGTESVYILPETYQAQQVQELYIKSRNVTALIHANPYSAEVIALADEPIGKDIYKQSRADLHRAWKCLPNRNNDTPKDVVTQEDFLTMFSDRFSPDITEYTKEFQALYLTYSQLEYREKDELFFATVVNDQHREENINKVNSNEKLRNIKREFDELKLDEQLAMQKCFSFLKSGEYIGTDQQFEQVIGQPEFTLKEKMLLLAISHQGFKSPAACLPSVIAEDSSGMGFVQATDVVYLYKITRIDDNARSAVIEMEQRCGFKRSSSSDILAKATVRMKYSVVLPEDGDLRKTTHQFDRKQLTYNVTVLNKAGQVPLLSKNITKLVQPIEAQRERQRIMSQVVSRDPYAQIGIATAI